MLRTTFPYSDDYSGNALADVAWTLFDKLEIYVSTCYSDKDIGVTEMVIGPGKVPVQLEWNEELQKQQINLRSRIEYKLINMINKYLSVATFHDLSFMEFASIESLENLLSQDLEDLDNFVLEFWDVFYLRWNYV